MPHHHNCLSIILFQWLSQSICLRTTWILSVVFSFITIVAILSCSCSYSFWVLRPAMFDDRLVIVLGEAPWPSWSFDLVFQILTNKVNSDQLGQSQPGLNTCYFKISRLDVILKCHFQFLSNDKDLKNAAKSIDFKPLYRCHCLCFVQMYKFPQFCWRLFWIHGHGLECSIHSRNEQFPEVSYCKRHWQLNFMQGIFLKNDQTQKSIFGIE